jgi:hypothetical protein
MTEKYLISESCVEDLRKYMIKAGVPENHRDYILGRIRSKGIGKEDLTVGMVCAYEQGMEDALDDLRVIKEYDTVMIRTRERGVCNAKVTGFSMDGECIGVEYWNSDFDKCSTTSTGVKPERILSVRRAIPCTKEHPARIGKKVKK